MTAGIFKKIQDAIGLLDERHAVLELAKGKFTTDPAHHTGEGIFFTSRMFDEFAIRSGETFFSHDFDDPEDWILQTEPRHGTANLVARRTAFDRREVLSIQATSTAVTAPANDGSTGVDGERDVNN